MTYVLKVSKPEALGCFSFVLFALDFLSQISL